MPTQTRICTKVSINTKIFIIIRNTQIIRLCTINIVIYIDK